MNVAHLGGCHCGNVRFEVLAPPDLEALECNCSVCRHVGFLHLIVPRGRFRLLKGEGALSEYRFGTGVARHLFCPKCGVKSFYVPRSNPDGWSVNVRCLEPGTIRSLTIREFDDRDRERSEAAVRDLSR